MRITAKLARQMVEVLDELREEMFHGEKASYPFSEWERRRARVKQRLRKLPELVRRAAEGLDVSRPGAGRPKELDAVQRTMLFLFARLMNKSNRDVEEVLVLFEPLFGFEVSYKSVERLYSDEGVRLVLHNLFVLLLEGEGVSGSFSGDGTGYSTTITRHYRSDPKKSGKHYKHVFRIIDLETGMYVGFGYSNKSEMEAFRLAMGMLEWRGIEMDEISLDRYYSSRKVLRLFGKGTSVYVIPKKNISKLGTEWVPIIKRMAEDPVEFLGKYFMRNLSESAISADKRRFGWTVRQHKEDRIEMAMFSTALLHNVFATRVAIN